MMFLDNKSSYFSCCVLLLAAVRCASGDTFFGSVDSGADDARTSSPVANDSLVEAPTAADIKDAAAATTPKPGFRSLDRV